MTLEGQESILVKVTFELRAEWREKTEVLKMFKERQFSRQQEQHVQMSWGQV